MSRWFRHYAGMMRDEKLVRVAVKSGQSIERVVWVWGAILESASEVNDGGRYDFDAAEAAYFLRASEDDIRAITDGLAASGRLDSGVVVKWGDRQFQSDRSATRQAAYRERRRESDGGRDDSETTSDGAVTAESRHSDAPETETETNTEKKDYGADAPSDWPRDFKEIFWGTYPRKVGKQGAIRELERVKKRGIVPFDRIISAVKAYAATADPQFTKHPQTWLSKGCWDDELPRKPAESTMTAAVITPESKSWNAWKAYFRDTGKNGQAALMDRLSASGKPFTVQTEWPPDWKAA